jgi:hypothetical protein
MLKAGSILLVVLLSCSQALHAQNTGIYESGIILDGISYSEPSNSLNNRTITKTTGEKLSLTAIFLKTFKNSAAGNVCKGYFFYRFYPGSATPPPFKRIDCSFYSNIDGAPPGFQNQLWRNNIVNIDLIRNLSAGTYSLEVFYAADAINTSPVGCNSAPAIYMMNGADAFKATVVLNTLNIHFTGFMTSTNQEKVFLSWSIEQVVNDLHYFIVEKSENGVAWTVMDTMQVAGVQYYYTDHFPSIGVNFYRVRAAGPSKNSYTIIRRIYVGRVENIVTIYPNPVFRNLRFQMTAIIKGRYDAVVYNSDGTRIAVRAIEHDGNDNYITMPLPSEINKGVYWLVIYGKYNFYKRSFIIE